MRVEKKNYIHSLTYVISTLLDAWLHLTHMREGNEQKNDNIKMGLCDERVKERAVTPTVKGDNKEE